MVASPTRVFIVDDHADTTESLKMLLGLHGYVVRTANSGLAAIEQAPAFKPDLMLVDLAMPQVDGCMVARQIRAMPDLLGLSLISVSGYSDALHRRQAIEAGFDECLTKPLPINELLSLLARVRECIATSQRCAAESTEIAAGG